MIKIVILAMCVFAISAAVVPKSHGIELSVAQQKDMIDDILSWLAAFGLQNAGQIAVAIVDALVTGSWDNVIALGGSFLGPIIAGLAAILFGGRLSWDQVVDALVAAGLGVLTDLPGLIPALIALDWATVWDIVFKHLGMAVFSLLPELMAIVLGLVGKRQLPGGLSAIIQLAVNALLSLIPGVSINQIIAIHQWALDNHESVTQAVNEYLAFVGITLPQGAIQTILQIIALIWGDSNVKRQLPGFDLAAIIALIGELVNGNHETVAQAIQDLVDNGTISQTIATYLTSILPLITTLIG